MVTIYGIKNCDSVKKARTWLEQHRIAYTFHDFRTDGLDAAALQEWQKALGWESLLNRRSRSWKELAESDRQGVDAQRAMQLMRDNPTLIKRPVVVYGKKVHAGFSKEEFDVLFGDLISKQEQGM